MTDNLPGRLAEDGAYRLMAATPDEVSLPLPRELAGALRRHVELDVESMRDLIEKRGGITSSSDVYALLRYLQATDELLGEYVRLLATVRRETLKPLLEEVLADAVGADDRGDPASGLTVPDAGGDIRITPQRKNEHHISTEQLFQAFASMFADQHADGVLDKVTGAWSGEQRAAVGVAVAEAIIDALSNVGELGKFEPQVSKVRAYAKALARAGHDNAAGIVEKSIRTTREYTGIGVERKNP